MTGTDLLRAFLADLDRIHADVAAFDRERRAADLEAEIDDALAPLLEGLDLVDAGERIDLDPDDLASPTCDCGAPLQPNAFGCCLECDPFTRFGDYDLEDL